MVVMVVVVVVVVVVLLPLVTHLNYYALQIFNERRDAEERFAAEEQEARMQFNRTEDVKKAEVDRRKTAGSESVARIREELNKRLHVSEQEWQYQTVRWLSMARRKVQVKKEEDEKARVGRKKRAGAQ